MLMIHPVIYRISHDQRDSTDSMKFSRTSQASTTLYRCEGETANARGVNLMSIACSRRLKIGAIRSIIFNGEMAPRRRALFIVNRCLRKSTGALSTLFNVLANRTHGTQRHEAPTRRRGARPRGKLAARGEYVHLKAFSLVPSHAMCASCSPCGSYPFVDSAPWVQSLGGSLAINPPMHLRGGEDHRELFLYVWFA